MPPETIMYLDGLDRVSIDCYSCTLVPALTLRDDILDRSEANVILHLPTDLADAAGSAIPPLDIGIDLVPDSWFDEGQFDFEITRARVWCVEEYTDTNPRHYDPRAREGEHDTSFEQSHGWFGLSQSTMVLGQRAGRFTHKGTVSGRVARQSVDEYCRSVSGWPDGLDVAALFALYTDEIIELGPKQWVREIELDSWEWTTG